MVPLLFKDTLTVSNEFRGEENYNKIHAEGQNIDHLCPVIEINKSMQSNKFILGLTHGGRKDFPSCMVNITHRSQSRTCIGSQYTALALTTALQHRPQLLYYRHITRRGRAGCTVPPAAHCLYS